MSVQKLGAGRWRVRVKHKGQVVADRVFPRQKDAQDWEAQQKRALTMGEFVDPKAGATPLHVVLAEWQQTRAGTVSAKTVTNEGYALDKHLPAQLLNRPLSAIRASDLDDLYGVMLRTTARSTVVRFRQTLGSMFGWAVKRGLLAKSPVTASKVPVGHAQGERQEVYPYTLEELRAVVADLHGHQGEVALVLGLTGLRWGELEALQVKDFIQLPTPALHVRRSAPSGQPIRNITKGGGRRTVPVPNEALPIVRAYAGSKGPEELLFQAPRGGRLNGPNWKRSVKWSANCRGRREHDLRHTAATLWLQMGVDLKTVQAWLGHSTAKLTLDTYSHWMGTDADAAALARVNAALSGDTSGTRVVNLRAAK